MCVHKPIINFPSKKVNFAENATYEPLASANDIFALSKIIRKKICTIFWLLQCVQFEVLPFLI